MLTPWPRITETQIATLPAMEQPLLWVARDGSLALSGGNAPMLGVHDVGTGKRIAELGPVGDWISTADATSDGSLVVSAGGGKYTERQVKIQYSEEALREWNEARDGEYWPLPTERTEQVLEPRDFRLWVWDRAAGRCLQQIEGVKEKVLLARVSPKGTIVLALDDARVVYAFERREGRLLGQWKAPTRASCFAIGREDGIALLGSESGRLYHLDIAKNRLEERKPKPREPNVDAMKSLMLSACGRFAVSTTQYGLELFDITQMASRGVMYRKNLRIHSVEVQASALRLIASDETRLLSLCCAI